MCGSSMLEKWSPLYMLHLVDDLLNELDRVRAENKRVREENRLLRAEPREWAA